MKRNNRKHGTAPATFDFKDLETLQRYLTSQGRLYSTKRSGLSARQQRSQETETPKVSRIAEENGAKACRAAASYLRPPSVSSRSQQSMAIRVLSGTSTVVAIHPSWALLTQ